MVTQCVHLSSSENKGALTPECFGTVIPDHFFKSSIAKKNPCQHIPGRMGRWKGRKLEVSQNSRITPRGVGWVFLCVLDSERKGGKKPHPLGFFPRNPCMSSANPRVEIMWIPIVAPSDELWRSFNRSLMKMLKRTGPSLLPCITPLFMVNGGDRKFSIWTLAVFLLYRSEMTLSILPFIPQLYTLRKSKSRNIVSKAWRRSIKQK